MSASRPRSIVAPALFLGFLCVISAACSGILGLEELPLRPQADASPTTTPTDAATTPVPDTTVPEKDAAPEVDSSPPCDLGMLAVDPNNCGACGKVCKSSCAGSVCDADRLAVFSGFPRGIYVAGARVYFAVAGITAETRVMSCPIAGPCSSPTVERMDVAQNVRLLAVRPSATPLLTFFTYQGGATQKTSFYSCNAGTCAAAMPFREEPGLPVVDAIDIDVPSDHRVAFTTSISGVFASVAAATPTRSITALKDAKFLGYNEKYVWSRDTANIDRVTLDDILLPVTTLGLAALPSPREIFLPPGSAITLIPSSSNNVYQCAGATSDCAAPTPCAVTPTAAPFAFDGDHVAYGLGAGITIAGYATPCTAEKAIAPAAPAVDTGTRSIAIAPSHVLWLEEVGNETRLYRAPR